MSKYILKLYVTGQTPRTRQAVSTLHEIIESELADDYELTVINVLERPQLAEDEKIMATPTLVRELPTPLRRSVGDLSDKDRVLVGLDIASAPASRKGGEA